MAAAFLLDMFLGDPHGFPHPVRWMGFFIANREQVLRRKYPKTDRGELAAGAMLTVQVLLATGLCSLGVLFLAEKVHETLYLAVETVMCYQMLAARSLMTESMKVYRAFVHKDTEKAREAVSMIVGRDVETLSEEGIIKAAVETVAENTSDGVIAPVFYMAVGGVPLMFLYKAVNTMDSMVGYKNKKYLWFGRWGARLDDMVNLIPSRIAGVLMVVCAWIFRMDWRRAWRVFLRDRHNHKSPNSAQTEAACAGALGVELAGDAWYFGELYKKPSIGDETRAVVKEDILRANMLMYGTAGLMLILCCCILWVV